MASLLERMNIDVPATSVGPVRTKPKRATPTPYNRSPKLPRGDVNGTWEHDLYQTDGGNGKSLSARLTSPGGAPKMNFGFAEKALQEATGVRGDRGELSIRGASSRGNVVEVTGLVSGTTAEDVEAIFKRCGPITQSSAKPTAAGGVSVRLTFKHEKDAKTAETQFDKQVADGKTLHVKVIGGVNASLTGRLGVGVQDGSVDVLLGESTGSSKMRSDDILSDADARARAHVLVAPPGADPKDYTQQHWRGRGRGRGRRGFVNGNGRRGKGEGRMDVD
ncbi:hypothetical protein HETIRDRAFT_482766 [Heterobasidion irregulare TC 32-1]|uniref:RRM domain-containing protein n=1 Tax=Heterobasidion irregulare (strain TC 32-1) TaxID=747525 RepID=W4JN17_HETIT|nr:uncharacterized protein HETIRDRAFT_482766 [Heterobasidion irregulare TC 32-1]ETW74957.1 hypothetical protein HETIRDRAFT_482766 [Heterobasidion irregulare TC 32-1]